MKMVLLQRITPSPSAKITTYQQCRNKAWNSQSFKFFCAISFSMVRNLIKCNIWLNQFACLLETDTTICNTALSSVLPLVHSILIACCICLSPWTALIGIQVLDWKSKGGCKQCWRKSVCLGGVLREKYPFMSNALWLLLDPKKSSFS